MLEKKDSDEGYNSDKEEKIKRDLENKLVKIENDGIDFKKSYFVEKLVHNSANGVIYKGDFIN